MEVQSVDLHLGSTERRACESCVVSKSTVNFCAGPVVKAVYLGGLGFGDSIFGFTSLWVYLASE
jgi:hypothetical protein